MEKRIKSKFPLFANQFIAKELADRPDYFYPEKQQER